LLFCAIGPKPPRNERSGFGIASKSAGVIDDRPIDRPNIIFLPKSGNLLRCPAADGYGFDLAAASITRKRPINLILSCVGRHA
jgi:hypothetical protein